jgi:hypothetical protein
MPPWLSAIILGLVEGLTEFIPVSSTGHLLLTKMALGLEGGAWDTLIVLIQLGAILAVVALYFGKLLKVAVGLPTDPSARRFVLSVLIAFLPAVAVGAGLHDIIKTVLFESPRLICVSLIIGGVTIPFERGLAGDAPNYFVRHVFAQDYAPGDAPAYLLSPPVEVPLTLLQGTLTDVPSLERFGVISLSNVFDWSDDALVAVWADHLREHARPGAHVLVRKLNNDRPLAFGPGFVRDTALGARLLAADRSLFYRQIEVWVRT